MVDRLLCCRDQPKQIEGNSLPNQTSLCKSCIEYKCILEELTQELQSAKKIIQLLQDDINICKGQTLSTIPSLPYESSTSSVSNNTNSWEKYCK